MKKFLPLVAFCCLFASSAGAADFSRLVILHTNDTHGFDIQDESHNGMASVAAYKKHLQDNGYEVILLDAGDAIQDNSLVNFSKGKAAIAFMNAAGYDAGTLGNHEFDYGQEVLGQRLSEARFPIISSNVFHAFDGTRFVPASIVLEKKAGKIGVIGFSTPETIVSTSPKNVRGLKFLGGRELCAEAQRQVDALRKAGCDLVIGLGHMGSEEGCRGSRSDDLLAGVRGIDIFIDGHDHLVKNKRIGGALLVETGNYTKNIGQLRWSGSRWEERLVPAGAFLCEDAGVRELLDEEAGNVRRHLGARLGSSLVSLSADRAPGVRTMEMPLGDLVADAFLWQARRLSEVKVDFAIANGGGLRKPIPEGDVLREHLASVLPYNNQLFVCTAKGSKILEILEAATSSIPDAMGAFPQVAGLRYTLDTSVPYARGAKYPNSVFYAPAKPGSRVSIQEINGRPFSPDEDYTFVTVEFVANGGDAYGGLLLPGAKKYERGIGCIDADAFENYFVEALGGTLDRRYAEAQHRITIR